MGVHDVDGLEGLLAVEGRRDRELDAVTDHVRVVDHKGMEVPGYRRRGGRPRSCDEPGPGLTELFCAARDGDRAALAAAIRSSQAEVWRLAAHQVGVDEADDVTQDVFVRAWRALPAFRAESSGRTWLLAIARRACADALRRRNRGRRLRGRLEQEASVAATEVPDAAGARGIEDLVAAARAPPS